MFHIYVLGAGVESGAAVKSKLNGTNPVITSSMNVLRTVLQPTDNGKLAQESYFCYKTTNKLRFLIHLCTFYSGHHRKREHKMYKFVGLTNHSITRCVYDVILWPVYDNHGFVLWDCAFSHGFGESLWRISLVGNYVSTEQFNSPITVASFVHVWPIVDTGDTAVRSSLAGNLWRENTTHRAPCMQL